MKYCCRSCSRVSQRADGAHCDGITTGGARSDEANTGVQEEIKMLMSRHALLHSIVNNDHLVLEEMKSRAKTPSVPASDGATHTTDSRDMEQAGLAMIPGIESLITLSQWMAHTSKLDDAEDFDALTVVKNDQQKYVNAYNELKEAVKSARQDLTQAMQTYHREKRADQRDLEKQKNIAGRG